MHYRNLALKLFKWNEKNLISEATLYKSEISSLFAENFLVKANGKNYPANYDNYYDFLNQFRATIKKITYDFDEMLESPAHNSITIPLTAYITRIDNTQQKYAAILILKYDEEGKIILWHETYVEVL